jgi:hypothetical protein
MTRRADELEKQIVFLESFLANLEVRHVAEEIDDEIYTRRKEVFTLGLDATRTELSQIRKSLTKIDPESAEASEAQ